MKENLNIAWMVKGVIVFLILISGVGLLTGSGIGGLNNQSEDTGETPSGDAAADLSLPSANAVYLEFTDRNAGKNLLSGVITIDPAADESDISGYLLYWGKNEFEKVDHEAFIANVEKTGASIEYHLTENTSVPEGNSFFLVFSYNTNGEYLKPLALDIQDLVVEMEADFNDNRVRSSLFQMIEYRGKLYFPGNDGAHGLELMVWDGSPSGSPEIVADINAGTSGSDPKYLIEFNNKLYFSSDDGIHGDELWEYDGTNPPKMISGIDDEAPLNGLHSFIVFKDKLYFEAVTEGHGMELWEYDGFDPPLQTFELNEGVNGSGISYLTVYKDKLYFHAIDGVAGYELWSYNGENDPVLMDLSAGPTDSSPRDLVVCNDLLYFTARIPGSGQEICIYDGENSPYVAFELSPGDESIQPKYLFMFKDTILFQGYTAAGGHELYRIDFDGNNITKPHENLPEGISQYPAQFIEYKDSVYYTTYSQDNGNILWKYNGVDDPVQIPIAVSDSDRLFIKGFNIYNNLFMFTIDHPVRGGEIWAYDGEDNPYSITRFNQATSGSWPTYLSTYNDEIYFTSNFPGNGDILHRYNPVTGVSEKMDLQPGTSNLFERIREKIEFKGKLYFNACSEAEGFELWEYDEISPPGMISDINPGTEHSDPKNFTIFNDNLFFTAQPNPGSDRKLFVFNGEGQPQEISELFIDTEEYNNPGNLIEYREKLYFTVETNVNNVGEFWIFDGKKAPYKSEVFPNVNINIYMGVYPVIHNDALFFVAYDNGITGELWKYDGEKPPAVVTNIGHGSNPGIKQIAACNGHLYLITKPALDVQAEIWRYDEYNQENAAVSIFRFPHKDSEPLNLTEFQNNLYFVVRDFNNHDAIMQFDGTHSPVELYIFKRAYPVLQLNWPWGFIELNDRLYFTADDGINGHELWVHYYK